MAEQDRDPWKVLGITPTADKERLRQAYLAQVRQHHPDRFRRDAARYRQQEEYMKRINEAYQWALKNPPAAAPNPARAHHAAAGRPGPAPEPPVVCPEHGYQAVRRCRMCDQPICLGCLGIRESLCTRHYQKFTTRGRHLRVLREWGPLIAIIFGLRSLGVPGLDVGIAVLIYLALLGVQLLWKRRWFGCLALLLLPYSLVLAGVWSLLESLREWSPKKSTKG